MWAVLKHKELQLSCEQSWNMQSYSRHVNSPETCRVTAIMWAVLKKIPHQLHLLYVHLLAFLTDSHAKRTKNEDYLVVQNCSSLPGIIFEPRPTGSLSRGPGLYKINVCITCALRVRTWKLNNLNFLAPKCTQFFFKHFYMGSRYIKWYKTIWIIFRLREDIRNENTNDSELYILKVNWHENTNDS